MRLEKHPVFGLLLQILNEIYKTPHATLNPENV